MTKLEKAIRAAHKAGAITTTEAKRAIADIRAGRENRWEAKYERFGPHYQKRVP